MARSSRRTRGSRSSSPGSSWLPFATGLSIGAFVAFLVYLNGRAPAPAPAPTLPTAVPRADTSGSAPGTGGDSETRVDKPQFDFFTILPETEVNVPAWQSEPAPGTPAPDAGTAAAEGQTLSLQPGGYVLQVGSFQRFEDADRAKAELALLGVVASIQKVVINGGETWYRVRVGPIADNAALEHTRSQLTAAGRTFLVLKIKPGAED